MRCKEVGHLPSLINSGFPLKEAAGSNPAIATVTWSRGASKYKMWLARSQLWGKVGGSIPSVTTNTYL